MKNVLLTSANFIRSISNIDNNVNDKNILPVIAEVQAINLQSVIGTAMLTKLCSLVETHQINLTDNAKYKSLLDVCQYYIAYQVIANICMSSTFQISNAGVNVVKDDTFEVVSMDSLESVMGYYQAKADHYCKTLQDYILNNHTNLPEIDENSVYDIQSNLYSAASSGVWLGGPRGKNNILKKF